MINIHGLKLQKREVSHKLRKLRNTKKQNSRMFDELVSKSKRLKREIQLMREKKIKVKNE